MIANPHSLQDQLDTAESLSQLIAMLRHEELTHPTILLSYYLAAVKVHKMTKRRRTSADGLFTYGSICNCMTGTIHSISIGLPNRLVSTMLPHLPSSSGHKVFPVKPASAEMSACKAFQIGNKDGTLWSGSYGANRRKLLEELIRMLQSAMPCPPAELLARCQRQASDWHEYYLVDRLTIMAMELRVI